MLNQRELEELELLHQIVELRKVYPELNEDEFYQLIKEINDNE